MLISNNCAIMYNEVVETNSASFWIDEDNILNVKCKGFESIQIEHAIVDIETCIRIAKKPPVLLIADISEIKSISSEARDLYSSEKNKNIFRAVLSFRPRRG